MRKYRMIEVATNRSKEIVSKTMTLLGLVSETDFTEAEFDRIASMEPGAELGLDSGLIVFRAE